MKKILLSTLFIIIILTTNVQAQPINAHELVKGFYHWYGQELVSDKMQSPVFDDTIYEYVSKCTINRLRIDYHRTLIDCDYFTQSNDFDEYVQNNMVIDGEIKITNALYLVPVRYTGFSLPVSILVFVEKEDNKFAIIKVESTSY